MSHQLSPFPPPTRRSYLVAFVLGLLTLGLSPWAISAEVDNVTISFELSLVFAMLAALGLGRRATYFAMPPVAAIPFVLWPNNGYSCFATSVMLLLWMGLQAYFSENYSARRPWLHPLIVQLPIGGLYILMITHLYPLILPLNPAPFCSDCATYMPQPLLRSIGFKSFFHLYFAVLVALVLLRANIARSLMSLPSRPQGEGNTLIIASTLLTSIVLWVSSLLLSAILENGATSVPIIHRTLTIAELVQLVVFLVGGFVAAYAVVSLLEGLRARSNQIKDGLSARLSLQLELEQARKMEALGQLAGGVAHDFNNMLSGIFSAVDVLEQEIPQTGEARESLDTIGMAARAARDLTRQLLQVSQPRSGDLGSINVHDAIHAAVSLLRRSLSEMVQIQVELGAIHPFSVVDVTQLQSALINLGINAGHAMEQGGLLTISTRDTHREGIPYVQIQIRDSGVGIDPAHLPHIFEPFFTTRDGSGGTGLGLASVRAFCEKYGGAVSVNSRIGAGTTFEIQLPEAHASSAKLAVLSLPPPEAAQAQIVLVVDDDNLARRGAVRQLRMLGYTTVEAQDGVEAVRIFSQRNEEFDLIVLDVQMPGMSGVECLMHLRRIKSDVPVLFCSGYVGTESTRLELEQTGCPLLDKPFGRKELKRALARLEQSSSQAKSDSGPASSTAARA